MCGEMEGRRTCLPYTWRGDMWGHVEGRRVGKGSGGETSLGMWRGDVPFPREVSPGLPFPTCVEGKYLP